MKKINAEAFLGLVWPQSLLRNETLELRARKRSDDTIRRQFLTSTPEFLEAARKYGEGWDIYFGVSTRFKTGGKKIDCYRTRCVWVDLDYSAIPEFEKIPPDIIVNSGNGHHIYWLLEEPIFVRSGRWKEIESVNRALVKKFNGDIGSLDVSRILRVPDFNNFKYTPPKPVEATSYVPTRSI